jgi:hypothetical protein
MMAFVAVFLLLGPCRATAFPENGAPSATATATATAADGMPSATGSPAATPSPAAGSATITATTTPTPSATATATETPAPTVTPLPAIAARSAEPRLGAVITEARVGVALNIEFAPSFASRELTWFLVYCASPAECAAEPMPGVTVATGSAGATLRHTWAAGGDARPVVVCRYVVEIAAGGGNPPARWESERATDPRCDESGAPPSIGISQIKPDIGQSIGPSSVVGVTVTFTTGPGRSVIARYYADACDGARESYGDLALPGPGAGAGTVAVLSSPSAAGRVHHVDVWLMNGDTVLAYDRRGPC